MKFKTWLFIIGITTAALFQSSCKKEEALQPVPIEICEPSGRCFDTEKFANNLHQMNEVGYAFSIYVGETLAETGQGGLASRQMDPSGEIPFNATKTRIHMASVSKSITAIALLQTIREKNVLVDDKIKDWLPSFWVLGENFDKITFRDLLTHKSGIRDLGIEHNFEGLEFLAFRGVNSADFGVYRYQNENFSLLRLLIAMLNEAQFSPQNALNSHVAGATYNEFVQQNIMQPLGISNASLLFDSNTSLIFNYPYNDKPGVKTKDDFTDISGAFGWYLDAVSLGKIFSALVSSEKLLQADERTKMFNEFLGCYPYGTSSGTAYQHNGYWVWCTPDCGGMTTAWVVFPNNITAAMVVNAVDCNNQGLSPFIERSSITEFVVYAYENSWD